MCKIQGRVVRSDLIDDLVSFLVTGRPETAKPPPIQKTVTTVTRTHIRFADSGLSLYYICFLCLSTIYVSSCYFRSVSILSICLSLFCMSSYYFRSVSLQSMCLSHFYICVLMLLQVCLSTIYVSVSLLYVSSCYFRSVSLLYMRPHATCPHATVYVSSYYYVCPHTTLCVLILLYMCSHTTIYVLILLCHIPLCVLILLYVSNTSIYVFSYYYMYPHTSTCPQPY
jgi:hypothetical protein